LTNTGHSAEVNHTLTCFLQLAIKSLNLLLKSSELALELALVSVPSATKTLFH
jgi:hypothetical protein